MKITLNIDDSVMERLRREAAREGRTMSELVESALRVLFQMHCPWLTLSLSQLRRGRIVLLQLRDCLGNSLHEPN